MAIVFCHQLSETMWFKITFYKNSETPWISFQKGMIITVDKLWDEKVKLYAITKQHFAAKSKIIMTDFHTWLILAVHEF